MSTIAEELTYNTQLSAYLWLHPRGPFAQPDFQLASGNVMCGNLGGVTPPTVTPTSDCAIFYDMDAPYPTYKWNATAGDWSG